jgi:DNA-binding LytR/AlgR family response regulator
MSTGTPIVFIVDDDCLRARIARIADSLPRLATANVLDPVQFLRIHRSRIVRVRCVRELRLMDNREFLVKLSDGSEHRSSRSYADRLDTWLSSEKQ